MGHFRKSTLAIRVLLFAGMASATPAAAASFDGEWSVQIASASTACTNGAGGPPATRREPRARLWPPCGGVRLRHLARRVVLGPLDRAADIERFQAKWATGSR